MPAKSLTIDPVIYGLSKDYREFQNLRTEKTLTFVRPSGQFVTVSEGREIFTHDDFGNLVSVSDRGKKTTDGILFNRLPNDVRVTFDYEHPSYKYVRGDHSFILSFPGETKAFFDGHNRITYFLSDHVTLRFTVHGSIVEKAISINGAFDPEILHFTVSQDSKLTLYTASGAIFLRTSSGASIFESHVPSLQDSEGNNLHHAISLRALGQGKYAYDYDTVGLPKTYIIDPDTGYHNPLNYEDDSGNGGSAAWQSPGNVLAFDGSYATATNFPFGGISHYLKAWYFGFQIPDTNATIDGITVDIDRLQESGGGDVYFLDETVRLLIDGTVTGDNKADTNNVWLGEQYVTYGGSGDTWGTTPTVDQVNGTTLGALGVAFAVRCAGLSSCDDPMIAKVNHIRMSVTGTFSADFLNSDFYAEYFNNYSNGSCNVIGPDSLEFVWCQCGYIGACGTGRYFDQLPAELSLTLANDESVDMMSISNQVGRKLLRLKKAGGGRLADFGIDFGMNTGSTYCHLSDILGDQQDQKTFAHVFKQNGENGDYFEFSQSFSGFTLYVPKSISHDTVRVCAGKQSLGCTSSDSWSFRANDQGQIISTNGGFDTAGIAVSVVNGYWRISGLKSTGGEGQDSNGGDGGGGGGIGGYSVPEFSTAAFVVLVTACLMILKRMLRKRRTDL